MNLWLPPHDARVRALRAKGELKYGYAHTPFGECAILKSKEYLLALSFGENPLPLIDSFKAKWPSSILRHASDADEIIPRLFDQPSSISLMAIGTPFQLNVWEYLMQIQEGSTVTYGDVAAAIGRPTAARAVGRAVGANEISLLIPCHRVVSRGKLTGYRWGLGRKKALLAWELASRDPLQMPF
jgi:AraC family transcriptional regulator of adaptative response/methylated-DNA-[protein]-cysteine methyltransferase